jgi:chemotaxis protein CheD
VRCADGEAVRLIPIIQGEHAVVTKPDIVITTLLGSCIAVCLFDPLSQIGGMNHFLLGDTPSGVPVSALAMQRYGVHAMELLINSMMRAGAVRERLQAHIYGGANIIAGLGSIGTSNAAFARRFVQAEGIALGHVDVGGRQARKIEFLAYHGKTRATTVAAAEDPLVPLRPSLAVLTGELEIF